MHSGSSESDEINALAENYKIKSIKSTNKYRSKLQQNEINISEKVVSYILPVNH